MNLPYLKNITKSRKLLSSTFLILIGTVMSIIAAFSDKIKSENDLESITGEVSYYSFNEQKGIKNHFYQYFIYLKNHKVRFQVIASLAKDFNKSAFEKNIKIDPKIQVLISRKNKSNLYTKRNVRVYGIIASNAIYLNPSAGIETVKSDRKIGIFGGLAFILVGSLIFINHQPKRKQN